LLLDVSFVGKSLKVETGSSLVLKVFTPHKWFWYITNEAYTLLPKLYLLELLSGDKLLFEICLADS